MMIVTTIAEQTRFNRRNHGFSLNAANAPVSLLPAAPCSTNRRRRIPEAPFQRARLEVRREYDRSVFLRLYGAEENTTLRSRTIAGSHSSRQANRARKDP